jgi:hypothetical protein
MLRIVEKNNCPERQDLEREIHKVVHELARSSRTAASIAGAGEHEEFQSLRTNFVILAERFRVLCYCLRLHKNRHGC